MGMGGRGGLEDTIWGLEGVWSAAEGRSSVPDSCFLVRSLSLGCSGPSEGSCVRPPPGGLASRASISMRLPPAAALASGGLGASGGTGRELDRGLPPPPLIGAGEEGAFGVTGTSKAPLKTSGPFLCFLLGCVSLVTVGRPPPPVEGRSLDRFFPQARGIFCAADWDDTLAGAASEFALGTSGSALPWGGALSNSSLLFFGFLDGSVHLWVEGAEVILKRNDLRQALETTDHTTQT